MEALRQEEMTGLTQDRSGRTLKEYRQLYWDGKERIKELEAKLDAVKALPVRTDPYTDHPYVWYDKLMKAIGEQE